MTNDLRDNAGLESPEYPQGLSLGMKIVIAATIVLFIGGIGVSVYLLVTKTPEDKSEYLLDTSDAVLVEEEVAKYFLIPNRESPSVVPITDAASMRDNPFFANAQDGDTVLIYHALGRAILWRPSEKKIVDVVPVKTQRL